MLVCPACNTNGSLILNGTKGRRVKTHSILYSRNPETKKYAPPNYRVQLVHCNVPECPQRHHTILPPFLAPKRQICTEVRQDALLRLEKGECFDSVCDTMFLAPDTIEYWQNTSPGYADQLSVDVARECLLKDPLAPLLRNAKGFTGLITIASHFIQILRRHLSIIVPPRHLLSHLATWFTPWGRDGMFP